MEAEIKKLENLFLGHLDPVRLTLLFSDDEYSSFKCLWSNSPRFVVSKEYFLYDQPSLLRVLAMKRGIFSEKLLAQLYKEKQEQIAFILEWSDHAHKVILFDTKDLVRFDDQAFVNVIEQEHETINMLFQKAYFIGKKA